MELQKLFSYTRQAVDAYDMIQDGDRIAIGISGGKDSLTLLYALQGLSRFYPKHFEVEAVTVSLGFPGFDLTPVKNLCHELGVRHTTVETQIGPLVFDTLKKENPCSLCARMRKGALNNTVLELGCNKVAYAHHKDDLIETLLLSLLFEGRIHSFSPKTYLDRMDLTVIRPLLFVPEAEIIGFARDMALPIVKNPCPADGYTKRQYAKELVQRLNQENPGAKERMFTAILNGNFEDWPQRILNPRVNKR